MLNSALLQHGMEILDASPVFDSAELLVAAPLRLAKGQGTLEPEKCNFIQAKPYSTFHPRKISVFMTEGLLEYHHAHFLKIVYGCFCAFHS